MTGARTVTTEAWMTRLAMMEPEEPPQRLTSDDFSAARGLIYRDGLLEMLDRAMSKRVTVISAPPGSGKTSLLRAWAHRTTNPGRIVLVSVRRERHDGQQFWLAVLDAIRELPTTARFRAPAAPANPGAPATVDAVLAELAERAEPLVLIIDDLHELRSADALAQIERMLTELPDSARVVLSARRDPQIHLHRWRLAGEVAEIRAADLQFTQAETLELLRASGIPLPAELAATLHRRTEGWAAGLRLAAISLDGHPDPERFVDEFSGTDKVIGEYLIAEMLERQPEDVRTLLLRTSLVDRFNGDLADALADRSGSEQTLLALEEANAFVVSLDAQRTWFRYHQLLADFLRLELRRTLADQVPDLHRRAARWFADRGETLEAVRHTVAAGDWPDAARLVADQSFGWVLDGQRGTIDAVLGAFPDGASSDHPDLALAHAASELNHGRLEEAAAQLALAESQVQSAPPARRRRLTVAIASLRLALARRSGQFSEVIDQVNLLDSSVSDESGDVFAMSSELRGVALLNLGIVETWSGQLADAERHLSEGAALARTLGRPYLEVACRVHQVFPSATVSFAAARERGRQAVALAERHGYDDSPVVTPALGALAAISIWMGEFGEGERSLRRAWDVAEAHIDPATQVLLHTVTGMLRAGGGQHESALAAFAAAARVESRLTGVHALASLVTPWLAATQARLGRTDEARASLGSFSAKPERMADVYNARAVIALAEGDPAVALDELRGVLETTPQTVPAFKLVESHLLAGIAYLSLGERSGAAAAAEAALAAAEPDRLILPFAMTGSVELLDALPRHETAHAALLADIGDLLRGDESTSRIDLGRLSQQEALSPSELRVLRYLPTNMTRGEVARELYVSINTVNTHIRNIYSKLGARDRSAAVQRARELRLVSNGFSRASPR
jgi:LuxR family maltose regulon positive regulatory protein